MLKPTFPEPPVWPPPDCFRAKRSVVSRRGAGSPRNRSSPATSRPGSVIDRNGSSVLENTIARDIRVVDRSVHIPGYHQRRSAAKHDRSPAQFRSRSHKKIEESATSSETSSATESETESISSYTASETSSSSAEETSDCYDSDTSESESSEHYSSMTSSQNTSGSCSCATSTSSCSSSTGLMERRRRDRPREALKRGHRRSARKSPVSYNRPAHTMYRDEMNNMRSYGMPARGYHSGSRASNINGPDDYDNSSSTATRVVLQASEALLKNSGVESATPETTLQVLARGSPYPEGSGASGGVGLSAAALPPPTPVRHASVAGTTGGYGSEVKFEAYIQRPKKNALCCA